MTRLAVGTKVRTLYQHSSTGVVCKPRKENLPLPGPDWFVVKIDPIPGNKGGKCCIHRSMLAQTNE